MENENIGFAIALTALLLITKEQNCAKCIHRTVCKHKRKPEYCYDYMGKTVGGSNEEKGTKAD